MTNTPKRQLVVGAGLIGSELARQLIQRGDDVTLATRSGTKLQGARSVTLNASDAAALTAAAHGASTIFLCTNPPYSTWPTDWPPIFAAVIAAAKASGARLVIMGNLYGYGKASMPMTEHSPFRPEDTKGEVRAEGWRRIHAAHEAGEITAVEVRASDYIGPHADATSHVGKGFFSPILNGNTARVIGDPALPHSWSYLPDIAATLIAASDTDDRDQWGRAWVVPSTTRTRRELAAEINDTFGSAGRAARLPRAVLRLGALFNADVREVLRSSYQFEMPFVVDSTETERILGVTATDWAEVVQLTGQSYR
ncbi:NAD-dependent epimerase/dehydratase family protein [Lysinibacter cavernae]|uniref:Nucleoside-diphosphate-sugar epimerase n=1 Tax=Lysinibacter cavernae TaxID=1640652 RepID=A0A7X5R332_9MICO|nr:NAD-dependent epimerase/dehydratase family protein [Lysinibacter cavernae]NIH54485.1 nucleoside-diphosphate-sugar epimerase [Lysinibacter cavernae]